MYRKLTISSLLFLILFGSCIREDLTECIRGLRLDYCYVLNMEYKCILEKEVKSLRAFIFDESTQLLVKIVELSPDDINRKWIDVDLPVGMYTISSWGSSGRDMEQGGFIDAELNDSVTSTFTPRVTIGKTTIDKFRMMLATQPLRDMPEMRMSHETDHDMKYPGEISPVVGDDFDDLYFAMVEHVEVVEGELRIADIDMIQNTSTIHLKVTGLEYLSLRAENDWQPFVCISGHNERHNFDNSIDSYAREVCYEPLNESTNGTEMSMAIRVMHLDINRFEEQPVLLHIRDVNTGDEIINPIDIINDVITKVKDEHGNFVWPDQESIDRVNEFSFEVSILAGLDVRITVNGFEAVNTNANVSRP